MLTQYIVDAAAVPWKAGATEGITFQCQVLLHGTDGGPEAIRFRFDPCLSVYAHMHLSSQFQLLIDGRMHFPKETMKLRAPAVHYSDHNVPYGPFSVGDGHDMLVLHPKRGGLMTMGDKTARRQINLAGRELSARDQDVEWKPVPGYEGARCKVCLPAALGPEAVMVECPPGMEIALAAAPYGRYEVVMRDSMLIEGQLLTPPGLRHVRGDEMPPPLKAGPEGATVMLLTFDGDVLEGGLTGQGIAVEAADALARAI
ncbi:MAG: hypothetical protein HYX97_04580 [Chloroflexi bacterium]|nr:hypothetical protein [Chloroflexota bacterium]